MTETTHHLCTCSNITVDCADVAGGVIGQVELTVGAVCLLVPHPHPVGRHCVPCQFTYHLVISEEVCISLEAVLMRRWRQSSHLCNSNHILFHKFIVA